MSCCSSDDKTSERKIQDISFHANNHIYKSRACGLIENDGKYLFVNMGSDYWCIPGGHIEVGEDSKNAAMREVEEETGMSVDVKNLFLVNENFFFNERLKTNLHEVSFYYLVSPKKGNKLIEDKTVVENDNGKILNLKFKWYTKEELENLFVKPAIVKDLILSDKIHKMNHIIFKD